MDILIHGNSKIRRGIHLQCPMYKTQLLLGAGRAQSKIAIDQLRVIAFSTK